MQNNNSGFSILEIIIMIALIGLLGSITLPNLFVQRQGDIVKTFIKNFSILTTKAITHAVQTNNVVQIYFDIKKRTLFLKEHTHSSDDANIHNQFKELGGSSQMRIQFPDFCEIAGLYIQGENEMESGQPLIDTRFYVMPTGIIQPVILNIAYNKDSGQEKKLSIQITPFLGRVQTHEEFTQP